MLLLFALFFWVELSSEECSEEQNVSNIPAMVMYCNEQFASQTENPGTFDSVFDINNNNNAAGASANENSWRRNE